MKVIIKDPILRDTGIALNICIAVIAVGIGVSLIQNHKKNNKILDRLKAEKVEGKLINITTGGRGFTKITILNCLSGNTQKYNLHLSWAIKEYQLAVGDSVNKVQNSDTLTFYKIAGGSCIELFEFPLSNQ